MFRILVINPGSTSTKLALYEDQIPVWTERIPYTSEDLAPFHNVLDQLPKRKADILGLLEDKSLDLNTLSAIAARGGPFKPLESGTYRITSEVIDDIRNENVQADHVSNLASLIAYDLTRDTNIPAFFVDPVCVDEMEPLARFSGIPDLERKSLLHALNVKAVARKTSEKMGKPLDSLNLVIVHLGGGITICPLKKGRIIDVNNANEEGPFSPERSGSLPVSSFLRLCFSQKYTQSELKRRINRQGGITAYLQTNDLKEVEQRIQNGDSLAKSVLEAMAYQIAKEIGAMSTVLLGKVDGIVITGGGANCKLLTDWITERVQFIAPINLFQGEFEMEALAMGVLRVLKNEDEVKVY
ncbi:butyrate kinase [candidate division KSB1 bacterium]|nr:butyrate kinase [candidate division KSB1 bacterium]